MPVAPLQARNAACRPISSMAAPIATRGWKEWCASRAVRTATRSPITSLSSTPATWPVSGNQGAGYLTAKASTHIPHDDATPYLPLNKAGKLRVLCLTWLKVPCRLRAWRSVFGCRECPWQSGREGHPWGCQGEGRSEHFSPFKWYMRAVSVETEMKTEQK